MSISGCESMNAAQGRPARAVAARALPLPWGFSRDCWLKKYAWNYRAVGWISPERSGSSVIHDWSGGTYLRRIYPFMKQPEEELQETLTKLDDRAVVDYLRHHPEFLSVTPMPWKRCVFHIPCGERFRSLSGIWPARVITSMCLKKI